jgi:phosphatidate cytidylyltransferase
MPWSRILSGIVAIALALGMIIMGGWYFTLGFCVIVYLGQLEYFELARAKGIAPAAKTTLAVSQGLLITAALAPQLVDAMFPLAGTLICFYLLFQPKLSTIADIASSILGLFYGGYLPSYWVRLRVGLDPANLATTQFSQIVASNLPVNIYPAQPWTSSSNISLGLTSLLLAFLCIILLANSSAALASPTLAPKKPLKVPYLEFAAASPWPPPGLGIYNGRGGRILGLLLVC